MPEPPWAVRDCLWTRLCSRSPMRGHGWTVLCPTETDIGRAGRHLPGHAAGSAGSWTLPNTSRSPPYATGRRSSADQPQQQRGLVTRLLSREEMVLVTSPRRDVTGTGGDGKVALDEVAGLPLVDFAPGWAIRHAVDRAFRAALVERDTTFEVNDIVAAAELVRHDLGVCIMPESIAARFPDLTVRRLERHAPHWNVMVVRPRGEAPPVVAALLRHIT
ncbi:hypothetical protein HRW23_11560 [Streptomyces lunaelactis]|nr:hypothetical protein [Streptomyces lunaelactis]NUL08942.1 hypothetical protein [Streptomyces lunaelactis]